MAASHLTLLKWLRAAGEPSRLRLLALCAEGALSVSDLAQVLTQSEPRVSRHLKILCEAGLIERSRQGQWVHYRLVAEAAAASFVRGLLAQLERRDPVPVGDRTRARALVTSEVGELTHDERSRLGRALAGFATASGLRAPLGAVLVVGVQHPQLLEACAAAARQCTALAHSRRAAQAASAFAQQRGFACRILRAASAAAFSVEDIAGAGSCFDAVILDHPAMGAAALTRLLAEVRALMSAAGRLWIFERYDLLESAHERVVEHPLARLRRLLGAAGLQCERLSPIEADGEHVLAAVSRVAAGLPGQLSAGGALSADHP
ncbi:MAG TPA: metalloregulator ArsR/SmtB family transcription factor [Steroidobacteraceae bacterium]|jgi:DNA-binding transcriptional ArsR family regulator|nr:metalloregulator ArsR/SmtB family transcription factor [Steroidobacteraceae bacterium]